MNNLQTHLRVKPYPYQQDGIVYGLTHKRLIIGDEPGLGKTLQSIGIVDTAGAYPCLVICPSSLKINWQREFEKFTDKSALVLDNSVRTTWPYLLKWVCTMLRLSTTKVSANTLCGTYGAASRSG